MFKQGLIAWLDVPRGLDMARALLFASLIVLPVMVVAAPGGIIAADVFLLMGCAAGWFGLRIAQQRLQLPDWIWWASALLFPYYVAMLFGPGFHSLSGYPIALVQHIYAPVFAILLVYGAQLLWKEDAATVIYRGIALSGLIVVGMDIVIAVLAMTGIFVFVPAFRDGFYPSRLDWPFARPSQLPGFLLVTFPVTTMWVYEWLVAKRGYRLAGFVTLINVLAHIMLATLSGSRAGFTGAVLEAAGLLVLVFLRAPYRRWPVLLTIFVGGVALSFGGLLLLGQSNWVVNRALLVFSDAVSGSSLVGMDFRAHNWEFAQRLFLGHPLFGGGLTSATAEYGYEIHNTFLGAFAELGVLGGVTTLLLIVGVPALGMLLSFVAGVRARTQGLIPPLFLAMAGSASFAATHYVLRQRWIWVSVMLMILLISDLRSAWRKPA
ncbi:MAG: hypothetical protein R3C71_07485 [Candidatus Krumholzibacteriia bacterium]